MRLILFVLLYPVFILSSLFTYFSYKNKNKQINVKLKKKILWDRVKLNLLPSTLFNKHIFWQMQKTDNLNEINDKLKKMQRK